MTRNDDSTATKYCSMSPRRQKIHYLLGLGVLTVEMSSDERKAQPWIFFGVDGDEDVRGFGFFVFYSEGRLKIEEKGIKTEQKE